MVEGVGLGVGGRPALILVCPRYRWWHFLLHDVVPL